MNRLLYLLILVAAVSLTAHISASGAVHDEGGGCFQPTSQPDSTPVFPTETASPTATPVVPTTTPEMKPTKQACNQGIGNGAEGCDPGNSNHNQSSNDEGGRSPGTPGPR